MSIDLIFYTQLGSVLVFIIALFVLYRLLVQQKDATIQLLEKQLQAFKEEPTDIVLKKLNERVQIARDEMERLSKDKESLGAIKDNAMTHIMLLESEIRADKDLIASLEEYKKEVMRLRPTSFFLFDVLDHLAKEGRTIAVHKAKDGTVENVSIMAPDE